jgi:hypothetical protein
MRALASAVAIAALALAPAARAADPPPAAFAAFQSLCLSHRGDRDGALKAADDAGWMVAPRRMLEGDALLTPQFEGSLRIKSTRQAMLLLVVGDMPMAYDSGRTVNLRVCALLEQPPDPHLTQGAEAWAATPPTDARPDGFKVYAFTERGGAHAPIAGDLASAPSDGSVSVIIADEELGRITGVIYGVVLGDEP